MNLHALHFRLAAISRLHVRKLTSVFLATCQVATAMTWSGDAGPWGPGPMNETILTWNAYSNYSYNIPVYYSSGIPTAQANYMGSIGFGQQGNYRTAMHESSHWMGTGGISQWNAHQRFSIWNGTYASALRAAYDGPGERQAIYGVHYGPQGANFDSEGVQGPQMVGIIGAFRRDMNLAGGDQTIGIASGSYRIRNRRAVKTLDSLNSTTEGAPLKQTENSPGTGQQWDVTLLPGTTYFTLKNVASGKLLDSLGGTTDGSPVGLTSLGGGIPTDRQQWQILPTDSFFFKIVNKASGKALDNLGATDDGAGIAQWTSGVSANQNWTFLHALPQLASEAGVISQGRPVASSSTDANHYDTKGNNGVSGDRWTASSGSFPQWWRVDTGSVQPITQVAVDWFPTGAPTFRYRLEISNDDVNWTVAADRTGNVIAGTTVDALAVTGRYLRVTVTGATAGYFAAFMECRVYNEATPMKVLSQFRPVTASSEQEGNLAVNANNIDPVFTRWCSNSPAYPAWWQVDLGTAQQVNKAVISWFDDDARSYQYRIEGSTDGTNFTTLIDRTDNTAPYTTSDLFSGTARYVRVMVTGGSSTYPSIYDTQISGSIVPSAPFPPTLTATTAASQINLSWSAIDGATGYTLKRSTISGGPYTTIADQTGTTYSDTTVLTGVPYYYVVSATNSAGTGGNSAQAAAAAGGELHAYLPFDETSGVIANDQSGFGRNGALTNGPLWAAGTIANAVDLDGIDDHVALPAGIVSGLNNFTIAAWVNPEANGTWARLFDFGTGGDNYMFLAPSNGSSVRFAIRTAAVAEQQLSASALPAGAWSHVAVTLSGNTGTLYVNGTAVAANNTMTLRPSSLGTTTRNWIGRSQFTDPYLNGRVDDFRIYNRALTTAEIGKLRGTTSPAVPANVVAQAGDARVTIGWAPSLGATSYKVKRSTTGGSGHTLVATVNTAGYADTGLINGTTYHYVVSATNGSGETIDSAQASATPAGMGPAAPAVLNPYEVGTQVKLTWSASSGAITYQVKRSTTRGGPYAPLAQTAGTVFTDSMVIPGTTYYYVVAAVGSGGEGADSAQTSALPSNAVSEAYLKMDETTGTLAADDSGNALNGTLINGPTRTAGRLDRAISLDGTNDHAALPAGAVSTLENCTVSAWVRVSSLSTWARVFDFGTGTSNSMFLTLQSSTGRPRFSIRTPSVADQTIDSSTAITLNAWNHIAVTISGNTGTLYLNGVIVGANGVMTLKPSSLGNTTLNYLGRSQFPDPYFAGLLDEFQIRDRALTATEITALASPPGAPTGLAAAAGNSQASLIWNNVSGATGYQVKRATTSGGPYVTVASNVAAANHIDTGLTPGSNYFYIVTSLKTVAESARSAQVAITALTPEQAWRQTYFNTTANTGNAADNADPDGDGWINANEYAAGTHPADASSKLHVSAAAADGGDYLITFPTVAGRRYSVERSNRLETADWQPVLTHGIPATDLIGTGAPFQIADTGGASQTKRFYRIVVRM